MAYDPREVELRWQERWRRERVFEVDPDPSRKKFYCLEMLPYPSGQLHMGHVRNYSIGDAVAWFQRMRGRNVLHAIGWDAMGLPAENAAIKHGVPPAEWTERNIAQMRRQLQRIGFSYDWRREIATCHPEYYRWNQWFFLRMLERDLAYRARRALNWCSRCDTVLANEQVTPAGCCWRHEDTPVSVVELEQWFIRTTRYAERLLAGLDELEGRWPERVIAMQRHWIGRSEGCRFAFRVEGEEEREIEVFTTRVDTVYGCSALFLAAEHPAVLDLARGTDQEDAVRAFVENERRRPHAVAAEDREKTGVFTGRHAINPFNGERVPIWVANFVLMDFGTGAVFAQPAHDQRDYEFARKYGLPIRPIVRPADGALPDPEAMESAYEEDGIVERSGPFSGLPSAEARRRMAAFAAERGFGRPEVQYRLKDWGVSRQRYWGTPIPVVYCDGCGIVPVPDEDLPVILPPIEDWKGLEGSPLARVDSFVNTSCPRCGGAARRETDTMDTFVDSSWYFLRYLDPRNDRQPFDPAVAKAFMPVDLYIGGVEHAVGHLIYCRFWTMMLADLGLLEVQEPAVRLFTQGMVNAPSYRCEVHDYIAPAEVRRKGGDPCCPHCGRAVEVRVEKMSKSKLNSVTPDELIERYGADAMRLFSLFGGPPVKDLEWSEQGIEGTFRFAQRVARAYERLAPLVEGLPPVPEDPAAVAADPDADRLRRKTHRTIVRVTRDIEEELQLNTAVAALMELVNEIYRVTEGRRVERSSPLAAALAEALHVLARLLAPFAPHLAEEMNARIGGRDLLARARWPEADPALLVEETVTLPVQVNGKLRGQVSVPRGAGEAEVVEAVKAAESLARHLEGRTIRRVVLVPDRLVNLVVSG
ncbi:MAG: leucine--tRNA ligase [Acidobacteria bacterium]|nr:MAG: leucine--tRNA ligase [Acidobacteriota bacterium]